MTAGLSVSGLATMLQTLGLGPLGSRLPIVQGISFLNLLLNEVRVGNRAGA